MKPIQYRVALEKIRNDYDRHDHFNDCFDNEYVIFRRSDYENAKTVYANSTDGLKWYLNKNSFTHAKGKLICIEPIAQQCEHELDECAQGNKCFKCGVKLKLVEDKE
jgi:hypothetical protein